MFIDPLSIQFLAQVPGVAGNPVLAFVCSWRGGHAGGKARIIYCEKTQWGQSVYLVDETEATTKIVEIPYEQISMLHTSKALLKNLQEIADSWSVNAGDLIDRLIRLGPPTW
jgi:hypothetical protein